MNHLEYCSIFSAVSKRLCHTKHESIPEIFSLISGEQQFRYSRKHNNMYNRLHERKMVDSQNDDALITRHCCEHKGGKRIEAILGKWPAL